MYNIMELTIEKIPTWALCYLINGDPTGLNNDDIAVVDEWYNINRVVIVSTPDIQGGENNPYFSRFPAFGLPTDVVDCQVEIC